MLSHQIIIAQNNSSRIEGNVYDSENNLPINTVFIELFKSKDSTLISFQNTNEKGHYSIPNIENGSYFIRISHPEYSVINESSFLLNNHAVRDFKLQKETQELDEVVIKNKRLIAEMEGDKLKIYVDRIPGIDGDNSYELLGKLPGIWVEGDSSIKINGSANVTILINGQRQGFRTSQDIDLLKSISAENIERVEIISGGSAKYDASDGSIINVITKSKKYDGIHIGLSNQVFINKKLGNSHNLFLNTSKGKFNASFSAGYGIENNYLAENGTTLYEQGENTQTTQNYLTDYDATKHSLSLYGNLNYEIDMRNEISFIFNTTGNKNKSYIDQNSQYTGVNDFMLNYQNTKKIKDNLTNLSLLYQHSFDSSGIVFRTKVGYLDGYIREKQDFTNRYSFDVSPLDSIAAGKANIPLNGSQYIGQIDLEIPFEAVKLELGTKYTNSEIDNFVTYYESIEDDFVVDLSRSDSLIYKEKVFAAYILGHIKVGDISLQAGARLERTENNSSYISTETVANNTYNNILPNIALSYKGNNLSTTLKFTSGITRPEYVFLNPYRYYINEFEYREGNPNLKPLKRNTLSLETNVSDFLTFSLGYHRYNDQIFIVHRQINNGLETVSRPENAASLNDFFANVSLYYSLLNNKWSGQLSLYGEMYNYDIDPLFVTNQEDLDTFTYFTFRFNNSYKLTKDLKIYNRFSYRSNSRFYQIYEESRWRLDLGVTMSLLKNALKLSVGFDDVFDTYNYKNRSNYDGYERNYERDLPLSGLRFSLSYDLNLGWKKTNVKSNIEDIDELNRFKDN